MIKFALETFLEKRQFGTHTCTLPTQFATIQRTPIYKLSLLQNISLTPKILRIPSNNTLIASTWVRSNQLVFTNQRHTDS